MHTLMAVAGLFLVLAGSAHAQAPQATPSTGPAVAASTVGHALAATGVTIAGSLDAPKGYHGYVGVYRGNTLPVYVTPDGHILIGTLYDLDGRDLTTPAMQRAAEANFGPAQWKALAQSTWFSTGKVRSGRVVYAFMDTQCPYCHKFWQAAQAWVARGDVELRIIPVAVISPKSLPGAGAVLEAASPLAAWRENERHFAQHQSAPAGKPAAATVRKIQANNALMQNLGFYGTPGVVYKDAHGHIHTLYGLPRDPRELKAIFEG